MSMVGQSAAAGTFVLCFIYTDLLESPTALAKLFSACSKLLCREGSVASASTEYSFYIS